MNTQKSALGYIDLFSGAGGLSLGFERAGLRHVLGLDKDKDAVATLAANRPEWVNLHQDIKTFTPKVKADILTGGFPCQPFSYAGHERGFDDTRGTLFFEFMRCADIIQPRLILLENVRGLLTHDRGRTFETIRRVLLERGYTLRWKLLNAVNYAVPQKRERLILLAAKGLLPELPEPLDTYITLREALKDVPPSRGVAYSEAKRVVLELVPEGENWRSLPAEIQESYMGKAHGSSGGRTGYARRLSWDEPSLTLTCSPYQKQTERCHPTLTRPLTVREYARIQTFPDDWKFCGSLPSQYRQIGNAVPVNLAYHIAKGLS